MPRRKVAKTTSPSKTAGPAGTTEELVSARMAELEAEGGKLTVPETDLTDGQLATRLSADMKGQYCWTGGFGWMRYHPDTGNWVRTEDPDVHEYALQWVTRHHDAACDQAKVLPGRSGELAIKAWRQYLARSRVESIVSLSRGKLLRSAADFDQHPDLMNAGNGVIDLTKAAGDPDKLRPHDPGWLFTKSTPVDYIPGATHPDWDAALEAVPEDIRDWYQIRLGQAVTGYRTPDGVLIVQQGSGDNGKSTLMGCVQPTLADYFHNVPHRALLSDMSAHPTEMAGFKGARLALLEELPEEKRLSVVRLKALNGTKQITAHYMRCDDMTFDVTHSLFINTNPDPIITETDDGTWRRLAMMRWPYKYLKPGAEPQTEYERVGDPGIQHRLEEGKDGQFEAALAWMVEGAAKFFASDRTMPPLPERIVRDTLAWRANEDLVLAYWDECLVADPGSHIASSDLLAVLNEWLASRGHHPWASTLLGSRFKEHFVTVRNRVEEKRRRDRDAASRPDYINDNVPDDLPGQYRAWLGVRFRDKRDDDEAQQEVENDDSVTGVTGPSVPIQKNASRRGEESDPSHMSQRPSHSRESWRRSATQSDFGGFGGPI